MNDEAEHNQAMLERMQMLEDALHRAEMGVATEDDWSVIRFECGVSRSRTLKPEIEWSE
jgi:hypothetical protein